MKEEQQGNKNGGEGVMEGAGESGEEEAASSGAK